MNSRILSRFDAERKYHRINSFAHPINFVYKDGKEETRFLNEFTSEGRIKYRITRIRKRELPRGIQNARTLEGFINAVSNIKAENPERIRIRVYEKQQSF